EYVTVPWETSDRQDLGYSFLVLKDRGCTDIVDGQHTQPGEFYAVKFGLLLAWYRQGYKSLCVESDSIEAPCLIDKVDGVLTSLVFVIDFLLRMRLDVFFENAASFAFCFA
ncbi:hypothetical protein Ancab_018778, partial [Ancistrocladus abbreviatus]